MCKMTVQRYGVETLVGLWIGPSSLIKQIIVRVLVIGKGIGEVDMGNVRLLRRSLTFLWFYSNAAECGRNSAW